MEKKEAEEAPRKAVVGSTALVLVDAVTRVVDKLFFPARQQQGSPKGSLMLCRLHEDGMKVSVFPKEAVDTQGAAMGISLQDCMVLDGYEPARKEAAAYAWLRGMGLQKLLTPEPLIRVRWEDIVATAHAPKPWRGAVACLQFTYGGPSLQALVAAATPPPLAGVLRAVPQVLHVLTQWFAVGGVHQDVKMSNLLFDVATGRMTLCGLKLASPADFVGFMRQPRPYAYFPRDYMLYAVNHGLLPRSTLEDEELYADWGPLQPRVDAINGMMMRFGLPPALVRLPGPMLADTYEAHFGSRDVEEEHLGEALTWKYRTSAVDTYMFGLAMLDFCEGALAASAESSPMLPAALQVFAAMVQQDVSSRACARDALSRWNFLVGGLSSPP